MNGSAREKLWTAVNAALDQRRDPLEDPAVITALEAAPESLAEIAALRTSLPIRIATQPSLAAPARRLLPIAIAAAAALLLAVGFWPHSRELPPSALPSLAASTPEVALVRGRVLLANATTSFEHAPALHVGVLEHQQSLTVTRP